MYSLLFQGQELRLTYLGEIARPILNFWIFMMPSVSPANSSSPKKGYAKQIRYLNYCVRRMNHLLDRGEVEKCLKIYNFLNTSSVSMRNLSTIVVPVKMRLAHEWEKEKRSKFHTLNWAKHHIERSLGFMELYFLCFIVLLLGGADATAKLTIPIVEAEPSQGIAPFLTALVLCFTILVLLRQEPMDLPISGPMTESEYEWLQDTLAYQAWLDNLSLSPIGELWALPF